MGAQAWEVSPMSSETNASGAEASPVKLLLESEDRVARVVLNVPRANVLDAAMVDALDRVFERLEARDTLRAIVVGAEGPHFSFGASIEEHLPNAIEAALHRLHALVRRMQQAPAPTIALVQGRCLGGGLELALACDLILAEDNATLACPEIQLGVFAPTASALLPLRIPGGHAARTLLTGAEWSVDDALAVGLVDRAAPEGELESTLQEWLQASFLPRSAAGLKHAARASRWFKVRALTETLADLERTYLTELCAEPDGFEGIQAFLDKRPPRWRDERGT